MLWTNHRNVPQASARYVNAGTDTLVVLGGSAAVSPQAITQLGAVTEFGANGRARAQITQAEDHMLALINKERARLDTEPLHRHPTLDRIARDWSTQMRDDGVLAHNPAHFGLTPWPWDAIGENVARVRRGNSLTDAAQAAYDSFATSPGHYLNMINPDFTHIGIGVAVGDRKVLVTQNFAGYPYDPIMRPPERPVIDVWKPDHNDVGARWEATSPLPITHWQIDDDSMPGEAPPFNHGYLRTARSCPGLPTSSFSRSACPLCHLDAGSSSTWSTTTGLRQQRQRRSKGKRDGSCCCCRLARLASRARCGGQEPLDLAPKAAATVAGPVIGRRFAQPWCRAYGANLSVLIV